MVTQRKKTARRPARRAGSVQSVERSVALLEALASQGPGGVTLGEISKSVGLNASTAHRLLATLIGLGYVREDARTKLYRLGLRLLRVGEAARAQLDLAEEAGTELTSLAERTQELSSLGVLGDDEVFIVSQYNSRHTSGAMFTPAGATVPLHCTALGKCLLAYLPDTTIDRLMKEGRLTALTANTITNPLQLREELERVRRQGYSVDDEEREHGVRCIGAPLRDVTCHVVGAISISAPAGRAPADRLHELGLIVAESAGRVSKCLGWEGPADAPGGPAPNGHEQSRN